MTDGREASLRGVKPQRSDVAIHDGDGRGLLRALAKTDTKTVGVDCFTAVRLHAQAGKDGWRRDGRDGCGLPRCGSQRRMGG